MNQTSRHKFIFIIGAGRSGTTLLASILGKLKNTCLSLENRHVWMYGDYLNRDDIRDAENVSDGTRKFIINYFNKIDKRNNMDWLIEKTPSNCFRTGFIENIFPGSLYIHLIRDGRAVTYSSTKAFHGINTVTKNKNKGIYIYTKQRTYEYISHLKKSGFPVRAWFPYLLRKVIDIKSSILYHHAPIWGVRYPGIDSDLRRYDDYEIVQYPW